MFHGEIIVYADFVPCMDDPAFADAQPAVVPVVNYARRRDTAAVIKDECAGLWFAGANAVCINLGGLLGTVTAKEFDAVALLYRVLNERQAPGDNDPAAAFLRGYGFHRWACDPGYTDPKAPWYATSFGCIFRHTECDLLPQMIRGQPAGDKQVSKGNVFWPVGLYNPT